MIQAGILGGSGYMGGEALRLLMEHPGVELAWVTSRGDKTVEYFHKNLFGKKLRFIKPEAISPCDVVFAALPSGMIMEIAPALLEQGCRIIDLGADFRLKNRDDWERKYGKKHSHWDLVNESVYGIVELHREEIKKARIIANPGCYSSAAILGLAPLVKNKLVDRQKIIIDGMSGTTGAGMDLDPAIHHPEIANNIVPYNVVDHRHSYEMEQELSLLARDEVNVHFTSSYVPITRGILAICHCFPLKHISREELLTIYRDFYSDEPFVKIYDHDYEKNSSWQYLPYPWVASVSGTNYCYIGMDVDEKRKRIVVFTVLDSIGKGGAHVAVQNMNLMFELPETMGLERLGMHPY
ncbi:MAG: N-acetyl-gamma-glutamyl-phosphate reductase [Spirochaetales bacterium]|nr:N-acetyl-gamma-glutamyl-phosphate reductase [Spirochaetales bacterium]